MKFFRQPRTTQEARASEDTEYAHLVRAKRRRNRLPNAWDDIRAHSESNWKRFRLTQYRSK